MVERVFRQGPDHISAPLQPCSLWAVGEYQAQHSTGGLSGGWGCWGAGHRSFVWRRDRDRMPGLDSLCVYLRQMDKQEESPAKHLSLQPPGIHRNERCCLDQQLLCTASSVPISHWEYESLTQPPPIENKHSCACKEKFCIDFIH